LGNLLFLQNSNSYGHFNIPILLNYSTWSLNYEVIYYLFFIVIFYWQPKLWKLILGLLAVSILFAKDGGSLLFLSNYASLFFFWLLGLVIAWDILKNKSSQNNSIALLSLLFLQLCQTHLVLGTMILHFIGIHNLDSLGSLFYMPFCFLVMYTLVGKDSTFLRFNKVLSYALPGFVFIYLIITNRLTEDIRWIICLIYWLLALLFYYEKKFSTFLMNKLTKVGKISYALYLLHVPVAILVKKTIFINNQHIEILVKYVLWVLITFALSILLENKLQPAIKKYLFSKKEDALLTIKPPPSRNPFTNS
jgi:peptidoglycan/LPS O-acetylase OafA/YrhL